MRSLLRLAVLSLAAAASLGAQTLWPAAAWPTATPAAVGLDARVLDSLDAEVRAGRYGNVDRVLVIRHGKVAFDRRYPRDYAKVYGDSAKHGRALHAHDDTGPYNYFADWWHPYYRRGDMHTLQSVTKTITSMVIGAAVTRGEFPSLDTPVLSFFDSGTVRNVDDRKRRMTVRHLLTMTAGFDWDENRPYADTTNSADALEKSYDWVKFTIDRPMMEEPGARFNYNSGASALLAHIFRRATGRDVEEYAAEYLFGPVGIRDWYWKRTPAGMADTEGGLYLAADDLARLWYLVLHDGAWNGRQILSRDWVRQSVTPAVRVGDARGGAGYGLKWWIYRDPTDSTRALWAGSGFGGQFPVAVPSADMVVVINQWNILPGQPSLRSVPTVTRLLNAVRDRAR